MIFLVFLLQLVSAQVCYIPMSISSSAIIIPTPPILPLEATQTVEIATSIVSSANVFVITSPTQIAQGARSIPLLKLISCDDTIEPETLSWKDSPMQLSIGDDRLLGAVIGNWLLLAIGSTIYAVIAYKFGTDKTHFPGGLSSAILFLITPTVSSALTLLRLGTIGQRVLGGISLLIKVVGILLFSMLFHPTQFGAIYKRMD